MRAAVRELDGAAAEFGTVERALVVARGSDAGSAPGAWEDAWLAAAALRARLDSLRDSAAVRLRSLPTTDAERAAELATELTEVGRSHRARWRSIATQIAETGKRLAPPDTRGGEVGRPSPAIAPVRAAATPAPVRAEPAHELNRIAVAPAFTRGPLPVGHPDAPARQRARGKVTALVTGSPTRVVTFRTEAPARRTPQPRTPPVPRREAPTSARATVAAPSQPTTDRPPRPGPLVPPASLARPPAAPALAPRASPVPTPAAPAVAVQPSAPGSAPRHRHLIALGLVAGVLTVVVAALAVMVRLPAFDSGNARDGESDRQAVGAIGSAVASPSTAIASPLSSSSSEQPTNEPIGFDEQRIGPPDPIGLPSVRFVGGPEVAAFPTPFDRSLRLTPPSSALCLSIPGDADGGASSISFGVYLGEAGTDGSIGFSLSPAENDRLAVALAALNGVDRGSWHHARVAHDGDAWVLALTVLDTGVPAIEVPIAAEASVVQAGPGEACVEWSTPATDARIFVDDVRVDR